GSIGTRETISLSLEPTEMKIPVNLGCLLHSITQCIMRFARKPALAAAALAAVVAVSLYSISSATQMLDVAELKVARVGHSATELADGRLLIIGGQNESGMVSDSEAFSPESKTFSITAKLLQARTEHTATLLSD